MLEHLFGSKTRLKLIRLFFRHVETPFFVRELTRLTGVQINAVRRELEILFKAGLVKEIEPQAGEGWKAGVGLRKYYVLDISSLLFPELQALLLKDQMLGQQQFIDDLKTHGGTIKLFILTGQFTGCHEAPSDLLLVGSLKERNVAKIITDYEQELGSEIRYTTMSEKEFLDRRHVMDKFLFSMFEGKNMKVVDDFNV